MLVDRNQKIIMPLKLVPRPLIDAHGVVWVVIDGRYTPVYVAMKEKSDERTISR